MLSNISLALHLAKLFKWILLILSVLFLAFMLLALIYPEALTNYMLEIERGGRAYNIFKCEDCVDSGMTVHINTLRPGMLVWIFIIMGLRLGLFYLLILEIIEVLGNVKNLKTFYEGNVKSFRKMGFMGISVSILMAFTFLSYFNPYDEKEFSQLNFHVPFGAIGFTLACFVLAEVFKEGKALQEDKESIL